MHQLVDERLEVEDNLPCADPTLLRPLKLSREYRAIRSRVADPHHVDSWQQEGFHFFVFALRAAEGADRMPSEAPVAVFTMYPGAKEPYSAVVVTPRGDGVEAEVTDLRELTSAYTAPISPEYV